MESDRACVAQVEGPGVRDCDPAVLGMRAVTVLGNTRAIEKFVRNYLSLVTQGLSRPNHPKQQHYVPQFLLRAFSTGKQEQVHAFDKQTGRMFRTAIGNVAVQKGYYDLEIRGTALTLEPSLSDLEARAAAVIKRIRRSETLSKLSEQDRLVLAHFAIVQKHRTEHHRAAVAHMNREMIAHLARLGIDETTPSLKELSDPAGLKEFAIQSLIRSHEFVPHLLDKSLILMRASGPQTFYIADNPIALHNDRQMGPFGNIGLAVPGIQIYLPIASEFTLAWMCPSLIGDFSRAVSNADRLKLAVPLQEKTIEEHASGVRELVTAAETGFPVRCSEQNVIFQNHLQVHYAERFVYCRSDQFALARQIVENNPQRRHGPRGVVG